MLGEPIGLDEKFRMDEPCHCSNTPLRVLQP
jgi:hypothetical protein